MLQAIERSLLYSRQDPDDPRLGDLSKSLTPEEFLQSSFVWGVLGYPDDEGIRLNGGRVGAALAPTQVRKFFYKMTPSLFSSHMEGVADLGDVQSLALPERHEFARQIVKRVHLQKKQLITIGGGHDYGYADACGFLDAYQDQNPLVINFDAHLDVRPLERGLTSGTPFFRTLSEFSGKFDFVEVGIQAQCNSQSHLKWAQEHGAQVVSMEDIQSRGLLTCLQPFLQQHNRPTFLSIDIDGFKNAEAPGCSQSWATGLSVESFLSFLSEAKSQLNVRSMGIYEVSPPLDVQDQTSKLAALLIHHLLS